MSELFDYLKPEKDIPIGIIAGLVFLFVAWLLAVVVCWFWHKRSARQIERCEGAGVTLNGEVRELRHRMATRAGGEGLQELPGPAHADAIFRTYIGAAQLKATGPVGRHLRALFDSGWNESQLDVRSLLKHTTDELFRTNALLRSLLSLFIVVGVLGTLFGLADTLAKLGSVFAGSVRISEATMGEGLKAVLGSMKNAFAPSIIGIAMTVLGVLVFSLYTRLAVMPLAGLLERMTLTAWVPNLIPTASQRMLENIVVTHQAAQKVALFADSVNEKSSRLNVVLDQAAKQLGELADTSAGLQTFAGRFVEGVNTLVPFGKELPKLYTQIVSDSDAFRENLQKNADRVEALRTEIGGQMTRQHEELGRLLDALKLYEKGYLESRAGIDEKLGAVLDKAEKAFERLGGRNDEIVEAFGKSIGTPLREELHKDLGGVRDSLLSQLGSIGQRLGALDAPLKGVADDFRQTYGNFDERTRTWLADVQLNFIKQNSTSKEQLDKLALINEQVPALMTSLTAAADVLSARNDEALAGRDGLRKDIVELSEKVVSLTQSMEKLNERMRAEPPARPAPPPPPSRPAPRDKPLVVTAPVPARVPDVHFPPPVEHVEEPAAEKPRSSFWRKLFRM